MNWWDFERWSTELSEYTTRSATISIPDDFMEFLLHEDFIVNPSRFPQLRQQVENAIEGLGGTVFVKLNYSAPTDAKWVMSGKVLKVTTFEDVMKLLKASTRIYSDITSPYELNVNAPAPVIILKKWVSYRQGRELRVFYRSGGTLFITSRYTYLPTELDENQVDCLVKPFVQKIKEKLGVDQFIADIYVSSRWNLSVIDIHPWNALTNPLHFSWEEIDVFGSSVTRLTKSSFSQPDADPAVPVELLNGTSLEDIIDSLNKTQFTSCGSRSLRALALLFCEVEMRLSTVLHSLLELVLVMG